jgi:hypothetical protein
MELPDGNYLATCGSLSAEAGTYAEAEELLRDMLDQQWEANPSLRRPTIVSDPDVLPDDEPEF